MTAFVTGSTGFLGLRFVPRLLATGESVRCLLRPTSDESSLLELIPEADRDRLEIVRGDLTDSPCLNEALRGVDTVYHLAASLGGSASTIFLNTVVPTRHLIDASLQAKIQRFVLISSMGVYDTQHLGSRAFLDEAIPVDPHPERRDPYTFGKVRQEQVAWEAAREQGLPLVVLRPGVIYGPGRSVLTSRVGLALGPLFIRMGGRQPLPYTHVENCAAAIVQAGQVPGITGEAFNIVDDDLPNGRKILTLLKRQGHRVRQIGVPAFAIGPLSRAYEWYSNWSEGQLPPVLTRYKCKAIWSHLRFRNSKAVQGLNWHPEISTEAGLEQTISAFIAKQKA